MTPIAWLLTLLGLLWVGYGSVWLLMNRSYSLGRAHHFFADLLGFPVEWAQATFGRGGVPYALLAPNMILFGLFTFLPLLLNFYVSFTGGESIRLFDRPMVGTDNYAQLFDCESILEPRSCVAAGYNFWTGLWNTFKFVIVQVPVLCAVSLITALVVDRTVRARGFWRALFFYPVMLSPVVIANIWQWVLHRKGVLNASLEDAHGGVSALAGVSGIDILATVVLGIALLLTGERAWRAGGARHSSAAGAAPGGEPSLPWALLFVGLVTLTAWWSNPLSLLVGEAQAQAGAVLAGAGSSRAGALFALGLGALLLWQIADRRRFARPLIGIAGALAMLALVTIQFEAVFDLGRYRPVNWLVTPNTEWPFFWLVFVYTWHHMGFYMLILLAGLQAIPRDLYEAAEMDASTPFRTFWRITFPLLMPTFTVVLVLSLIKSFQVFDEVYTLTGGGPGRETFMIVQYIFETAFSQGNLYGQAAAGSVIMAAVIAVFTLGQLYVTRRQSGI